MSLQFQVTDEVQDERRKQDKKWGPQSHAPIEWIAILGEEFGEASKEALEHHWAGKHYPVDEFRLIRLRAELIQVAAVAVAFVESLNRNELSSAGQRGGADHRDKVPTPACITPIPCVTPRPVNEDNLAAH